MEKFFESISRFTHLSPDSKEELKAILKTHELPKGHMLISQETICNHLFFVEAA